MPGALAGKLVPDVPGTVASLYEEARRCVGVGAYTGAALCFRKLLMNIAVEEGAQPGLRFVEYVDFFESNSLVNTGNSGWIALMRDTGNDATHEIVGIKKAEAEDLMDFVELLLRIHYEYPARLKRKEDAKKLDG